MSEKLTPWDAPKPGQQTNALNASNLIAIKRQLQQLNIPAQPPKPKKLKWYQFIKRWNAKYKDKGWHRTPLVYLPYLLLLALDVSIIVKTPGEDHTWTAMNIGFIIGIVFITFLNNQTRRMDEAMHRTDTEFARIKGRLEKEIELRDRFKRTGRI